MRRLPAVTLSIVVLTISTAAQEPARPQSDSAVRLKKKSKSESPPTRPAKKNAQKEQVLDKADSPSLPKKGGQSSDDIGIDAMKPEERQTELMRRLAKDFRSTQDRLDKADTGLQTQQLQQDIVARLSQLIEQAKQRSPGQQAMGQQENSQQQGPAGPERRQALRRGKPGVRSESLADLRSRNSRLNAFPTAKDPRGLGDVRKLEDLFRDVWGHLPETLRQEMNQYAREHFMVKYGDLLKQYYSTIVEKGGHGEE